MPGIWAWLDARRPLNVRPACAVTSPMATNPYGARPRRAISGISRNYGLRRTCVASRPASLPIPTGRGRARGGKAGKTPSSSPVGAAPGVSSFFVVKEVAVGRGRVGRCRPQCWLGEGQASGRRRGSGLRLRAARPQEEKLRHHRAPAQSRERRLAGHLAHPDRDGVQHPCQWNPFPVNQVEWPSRKG